MRGLIKNLLLLVLVQFFTTIMYAQTTIKNEEEDENNEGAGAMKYWEDLEKHIQEKNSKNGLKTVDRKMARMDAFKNAQAASLRAAISITGTWEQVTQSPNNTGMGRIEDVAFDPTNANIFYVATSGGGVWKTINGGASYIPRTDGLPTGGVSSIVVDQNNPNVIYIFVGGGLGSNYYPGVIYKSTDASVTWRQTGYFNMPAAKGYELKMHPTNSSILFLASTIGLYKTIDAGLSWNIVLVGTENNAIYDVEFKPGTPSTIYATGQHKVYISESNGDTATWVGSTMPGVPSPINGYSSSRLAVSAAAPNDLFIALGVYSPKASSDTSGTVFYAKGTNNPGNNSVVWNFSKKVSACTRLCYRSGGGRIYGDIYASQTNSAFVMIGGVDNFTTYDAGNNWVLKSKDCINNLSRNIHDDVGKIRVAFGKFFVATDGGLHSQVENYINSSAPWNNLSAGMEITQLYTHDATAQDPERYMYANQDNSCQVRTSGFDYHEFLGGDGTACKISTFNKDLYYGCIQKGEYLTRHNINGTTVDITPNLLNVLNGFDPADTAIYTGSFVFANAFEISQNNSSDVYAVKRSLYKSFNQGDNWVIYNIPGATNTHDILRVGKSNNNRIYVTESNTDIFQRSDNGGLTWTDITANKPVDAVISDIAINPANSLDIYITYLGNINDAKVFHSTNGGATWINISYGLPNVDIHCIVLTNNAVNGIYIGNDFGVYYYDNNIGHWINFSNGLPIVFAMHLVYDDVNNKLSVSTYGRGIWVSDEYDATSCAINKVLNSTYYYRNVYTASNDITSAGTVYGDANSHIKYSAGHQVIMQPGFTAQLNSDFVATLEGCTPAPTLTGRITADTIFVESDSIILLKYNKKIKNKNKPNLPMNNKIGEMRKED